MRKKVVFIRGLFKIEAGEKIIERARIDDVAGNCRFGTVGFKPRMGFNRRFFLILGMTRIDDVGWFRLGVY